VVRECHGQLFGVVDDSFEAFVDRVGPRLARAFTAAYGPQRGEEAVSEALAYAWENWGQLVEMDNPAGYLYRVGQSRTRLRSRVDLPPSEELGLPAIEPGLVPALRQLTERQRVCVALVIAHGWSYTEVGELLEISKSTVQNHVERALAHLRARLGAPNEANT
jgi:DNA-directed RNA polymerase specialized sigma24 family protein